MTTLDQKVASLELSKQLYEAGIVVHTMFEWVNNDGIEEAKYFAEDGDFSLLMTGEHLISYFNDKAIHYPAPLSSELGELLPEGTATRKGWGLNSNIVMFDNEANEICSADTEANARAKMLLYLKEKGLI